MHRYAFVKHVGKVVEEERILVIIDEIKHATAATKYFMHPRENLHRMEGTYHGMLVDSKVSSNAFSEFIH